MMLDYRIETFLKVCETLNFTKAAKELNTTQPAISNHIKYIEDLYDTTLFIRDKKHVTLTKEGELLYNTLKSIRNDDNTLKERIKAISHKRKLLSFGFTKTIGEFVIKDGLISLIQNNQDTNFKIYYKNTKELLYLLEHGKIDFAIVEGYFPKDKYNIHTLKNDDFILVSSYKHVFNNQINNLSDILQECILLREEGSGSRDILSKALALKNLNINDFNNTIEINSITTLKELLINDVGISFIYRSAVNDELNKGLLKEIKLNDLNINYEFNFISNLNSLFDKEYQKIFNFLKQNLK